MLTTALLLVFELLAISLVQFSIDNSKHLSLESKTLETKIYLHDKLIEAVFNNPEKGTTILTNKSGRDVKILTLSKGHQEHSLVYSHNTAGKMQHPNWSAVSKETTRTVTCRNTCKYKNLNINQNTEFRGNLVVENQLLLQKGSRLRVSGALKAKLIRAEHDLSEVLVEKDCVVNTIPDGTKLLLHSSIGRIEVESVLSKGLCLKTDLAMESAQQIIFNQRSHKGPIFLGCNIDRNHKIWPRITILGWI